MLYFLFKPFTLPSSWRGTPEQRSVPLCDSLGATLAETVKSCTDVPPYSLALRDGWAVRTDDPLPRQVKLPAVVNGEVPGVLGYAEAVWVNTGGMLPPRADAVIADDHDAPAHLQDEAVPGRHVLHRGADWQRGEVVLEKGTEIGASEHAMLLEAGIERVPVCLPPTVGIVATGSELIELGCRTPASPKRCSSNTCYLRSLFLRLGIRRVNVRITDDDPDAIADALKTLAATCSFLITIGGTGKGSRDVTRSAVRKAGGKLSQSALCADKTPPFIAGSLDGIPLIGLPGNPLGAVMIAQRVIVPLLWERTHMTPYRPRTVTARFEGEIDEAATGDLCVNLVDAEGTLLAVPVQKGTGRARLFRETAGTVCLKEQTLSRGEFVTVECFAN